MMGNIFLFQAGIIFTLLGAAAEEVEDMEKKKKKGLFSTLELQVFQEQLFRNVVEDSM